MNATYYGHQMAVMAEELVQRSVCFGALIGPIQGWKIVWRSPRDLRKEKLYTYRTKVMKVRVVGPLVVISVIPLVLTILIPTIQNMLGEERLLNKPLQLQQE